MKIGYQTLNWSASIYEKEQGEEQKENSNTQKIMDYLGNIIAILFAMSLFILLPLFLTTSIVEDVNEPIYFNIISGVSRILIFISY